MVFINLVLLMAIVMAFMLWMARSGWPHVKAVPYDQDYIKVSRRKGTGRGHHLVPKNDSKRHDVDLADFRSCPCNPDLRSERDEDNMVMWIFVHNRFDEMVEENN